MPKGIPNKPRAPKEGVTVYSPAGGPASTPATTAKLERAMQPTRADEVRTERRKRPGSTALAGIKLHVDESKLDRKNYAYRFPVDKGGRIEQLHAQDWDIAPEAAKPDSNSGGTVNSALAGTDEAGKPYNHVLMRKRKDWFEEDQKEKQAPLDAMDEAIKRGNVNHKANDLRGDGVYTPDGGNTLDRV